MNGKTSIATAIVMGLVLLWVIVMSAASLMADGWLYRIVQPVPVVAQDGESVTVLMDRYSRCAMDATCNVELVCDYVHIYEPFACPVERGRVRFLRTFPLPSYVDGGTCRLVGLVSYAPLGAFGPRMVYEWRSEEFVIGGGDE